MFWEFATDSYDIGFGVYFEWTIDPPTQVSVQVSESSDEEDLDEEYPEGLSAILILLTWFTCNSAITDVSMGRRCRWDVPLIVQLCLFKTSKNML